MLDQVMSKALGNGSPTPKEAPRRPGLDPGALRGSIKLTLHTADAVKLYRGRSSSEHKVGIPGLYKFGGHLETVAAGSAMDDPFADWTLVRIEHHFAKAEKRLQRHLGELDGQRTEVMGLTISPAHSMEPVVAELKLRSPHAFIAARLIGLFDRVLSMALTLAHVGLLERQKVNDEAGRLRRVIRRPFFYSRDYRLTGVTRADVREGTEKAVNAAAHHNGYLPAEILDGSLAPRFSMRPKAPVAPAGESFAVREDGSDRREPLPNEEPFAGEQVHEFESRVSA